MIKSANLTGYYTIQEYPEKLQKIKLYDEDTDTVIVFLTNNFDHDSEDIALLFKNRWQVVLENQIFLGKLRKCCSSPDFHYNYYLLSRCYYPSRTENKLLKLRNNTGSWYINA